MDGKRKASLSRAGDTESENRAAKRPRKLPDFDLSIGESIESTTQFGLHLLEFIRKVADKNGRSIAGKFEYLLPRNGNEEYYARTKMPICLQAIERKLNNGDFSTLSELEGYFKRMIANNKEFFRKGSDMFQDTERVRKALSNYMRSKNPAYTRDGYSCEAAPIQKDYTPHPDDFAPASGSPGPVQTPGKKASRGFPSMEAQKATPRDGASRGNVSKDEDDADVDEKDGGTAAEEGGGDEDAGEQNGDEYERGGNGDNGKNGSEDLTSGRGRRKIILKTTKTPESTATETSGKQARGKPDHEYEGVPYKGLNFQEAQEKIVEELIRAPGEEYGEKRYEEFINLPPRKFKDYFAVISQPLSLKGLQKEVKGIHGRHTATGVSDFKGWAAFEERASLLWRNAHLFNETGSEIHNTATELKRRFERELSEAKAVVAEPPQPKIKLRVPPAREQSLSNPGPSNKIIVHVHPRDTAIASPAPILPKPTGTASAVSTPTATLAPAFKEGSGVLEPGPSLLGIASNSQDGASGTTSTLSNGVRLIHDGVVPTPNAPGADAAVLVSKPAQSQRFQVQFAHPPVPSAPPAPAQPPSTFFNTRIRAPGRGIADALIPRLVVRSHPTTGKPRFNFEVRAHPQNLQQSVTIMVPPSIRVMQIIPIIPPLQQQQRQFRLFVVFNGVTLSQAVPVPLPEGDDIPRNPPPPHFEAGLQPGINWIEVHVCAALPKGVTLPNGSQWELEKVTVAAHLLKTV